MSILVTGGAGYIGSHMVWRLLDAGEDVVVLDRLSTGFDWAVPREAELVIGDVGDEDLVGKLIREKQIEAVIHFAGSIIVPESVSDPLGYYLNNTVKSRSLIDTCVGAGVRSFIFSSTAAVYGTPAQTPVSEAAGLKPESPYGSSKLMTEIMLRDAASAHDFAFAALRYFNVAGADPAGRTGQSTKHATHLIKVATQAALGKRQGLDIYGTDYATEDGTCVRDYIHVSDLVDAHHLALRKLRSEAKCFVANCGYERGYSVREVVDTVKAVGGVDFPVQECPRRPGDPAVIVADASFIKSELDWTPRHDNLEEIVAHALDWERALTKRNSRD